MMTNAEFKARLVAREPMLGAFIKTPHPIVIEIMARAGFDFLVVDDLELNVKVLAAKLTAEYFDVVTAMSGAEAGTSSTMTRIPVGSRLIWVRYSRVCGLSQP